MKSKDYLPTLHKMISDEKKRWPTYDSLNGRSFPTLDALLAAFPKNDFKDVREVPSEHPETHNIVVYSKQQWTERIGIHCKQGEHYVVGPPTMHIPNDDRSIVVSCSGCKNPLYTTVPKKN